MKAAEYFEEGKGASEVAKLLGVRRQSAHGWLQAWSKAGVTGLASKGPAGHRVPKAPVRRVPRVNSVRRDPAAKVARQDRKGVAGRRANSIAQYSNPVKRRSRSFPSPKR